MAQKNDAQAPAQKKGSGAIKKSLLILIGVLLLVGGSIGATLFLTGALHKGAADDKTAVASANAATDSTHAPTKTQPALYQPLDPPFIINFEDQGVLRYLQIGLSVMARDKLMIDAVNNNMPQIRNNLILLFANQKLDHLASNDGKEKLRAQALEQVQAVLHREIGEPGIEAVYYTAFVMQ
jgi:flagellar FliL protein